MGSVGVVLLTGVFSVLVFSVISMCFGLLGMIFSTAIGSSDLMVDAGIVGTAGGMIWGFAGAMLSTSYIILKTWIPTELSDLPP